MNSWKECPNMFVNGKFKFIDHWGEEETLKGVIVYDYGTWVLNSNGEEISDVEYCKLIARPISDMSNEEQQEYDKKGIYSALYHNGNKSEEDGYIDTPESFLYLLSIGVLPPIFDDTDVIWRCEND